MNHKKDMHAEIGTFPQNRQVLYKILPIETPLALDLHITHRCNFRCNYCILSRPDEELAAADYGIGGLRREIMSWETFSLIVEQLNAFPSKLKMITMSGIGEATTHPRIADMVKALHDAGVTETIQIITNGALLSRDMSDKLISAGLNELRISLQGLTADKYFEICKAKIDWDTYYDNICYFAQNKGDCTLKVKIVDTVLGEGDEEKFYSLFGDICDAIAVEHVYNPWEVNGLCSKHKMLPTDKTRYGREFREIAVCPRPFTRMDILPDGTVTQFCHVCFGHEKNVREMPLYVQWNGDRQNELRINQLKGLRNEYPQCKRCTFVTNTWHPEDILDGHEAEILERMQSKGMV